MHSRDNLLTYACSECDTVFVHLQGSSADLSEHVFFALDAFGYSQQIIHYRREAFKNISEDMTHSDEKTIGFSLNVVGSKGEGLTCLFESDVDVLGVFDDILCVEESTTGMQPHECLMVFQMDSHGCYPGYVRLKWLSGSKYLNGTDMRLMASPVFLKAFTKEMIKDKTKDGFLPDLHTRPATTGYLEGIGLDIVIAYRCRCSGVLKQCAGRSRPFKWPSRQVRDRVVSTEACLVPVSSKMCRDSGEWRICFNKGEQLLMEHLNETQIKLYVTLKIVVKEMLLPRRNEVNSYIMKNIVFWMAELYPETLFQKKNFCRCLMKALAILEQSILTDYLPYYMIPGRNILGEVTMPVVLKARMLMRIKTILKTGPEFILKWPKMKAAITKAPKDLKMFENFRDEVERLHFIYSGDDGRKQEVRSRLIDLVCPHWAQSDFLTAMHEVDLMDLCARIVLH